VPTAPGGSAASPLIRAVSEHAIAGRLLAGLFIGSIALHVGVILWLPYFVTVDGATHVGAATALVDALLGRSQLATELTTIQLLPATNLILEIPLGVLVALIGPQLAEKIIVVGYVVGFPLAVAYAVRGVDRGRWWLAFVAIPLTFSFALNYGFYNFCYGLIGFVLTAGYAARHRRQWSARSSVVLAALATATYAAHVLPFGQVVLLFGLVALWDWWTATPRTARGLVGEAAPYALAATPGLLLTIILVLGSPPSIGPSAFSPLVPLLGTLVLAWGMVTYDLREIAFTTLVAACLLGLFGAVAIRRLRDRRLRRADAYLLFGIAAIIEVAVVPSGAKLGAGGVFVAQRLGLVSVVGLVLWLASHAWSFRVAAIVGISSVVAAVGLIGLRLPAYATLSDHVEAYVALAPCLATDATMIQANLGRIVPGSLDRTDHFSDDAGRLTALTHGWPLANVEFEDGFFPLQNRPDVSPYKLLIPVESRTTPFWEPLQRLPSTIDLARYEAAAGRSVDYILVFGRSVATAEVLAKPAWLALTNELQISYSVVAVSADRLLEVYERTGSTAAVRGRERRAAARACSTQ